MFSPGQLVKLKSNGPVMTVLATNEEKQEVHCVWYCVARNTYEYHWFAIVSLETFTKEAV